jgi:hypothetical protein
MACISICVEEYYRILIGYLHLAEISRSVPKSTILLRYMYLHMCRRDIYICGEEYYLAEIFISVSKSTILL